MSFLTLFALGIAVLVAAPYVAHRLRRQRAEQHPFAPVRLVPPTPPEGAPPRAPRGSLALRDPRRLGRSRSRCSARLRS